MKTRIPSLFLLSFLFPILSLAQPGPLASSSPIKAGVAEQIRYADQFQWSQRPAGTITVGSNTITINAVRGISGYSCAPPATGCGAKFRGYHTTHPLRIAGTGTPEVVKIVGTTCVGTATGTCTVTFSAAYAHPAGYTLSTATAGFTEALVDSYTQITTNPATGRTIACNPYSDNGHYIIYGTIFIDDIAAAGVGDTFLEGNGCVLEDAVSGGPMIRVDSDRKAGNLARVTMEHFGLSAARGLLGRSANGATTMILDQSQGFHFLYNHFAFISSSDVVDTILQVSGDQQFTADHNDFENLPMLCDTTWCGPVIYGDGTANAALGDIHDNYFSSLQGTFIEWQSGNGLSIKDNVFQNWTKYPWRYTGGYQDINDEGGNYYEGNCGAVNPDFGVPGYACNTGPQYTGNHVYNNSNTNFGGMLIHKFSNTGPKMYSYYIVGNNAGGQQTKPLYIGEAATDGKTPFDILFLPFKAKTYDVLRAGPIVGDGTDASPYGSGNWAVSKGIVCATLHCTFRETFAPPLPYTVNSYQASTYTPPPGNFTYWPVPLFINSGGDTPKTYVGPAIGGLVTTDSNMSGTHFYDALFTSGNFHSQTPTGTRILNLTPVQATSQPGNANPGAWLLNFNMQSMPMFNRKGRINMAASNGGFVGGTHDSCLYQSYDSNAMKTFATSGHQPLFDVGDTCMGFDTDPSYLAFQGGIHAISFYVNHVMDSGKSAVAQFLPTGLSTRFGVTSTLPTGTAPFTVTSTTPVAHLAATPTTYNAAGMQQANAHVVIGSCVLGTSCAVKLVGAATFSEASSYNCTAQDRTSAAATKIVQASGGSFTITGSGTDTVGYSCVGN